MNWYKQSWTWLAAMCTFEDWPASSSCLPPDLLPESVAASCWVNQSRFQASSTLCPRKWESRGQGTSGCMHRTVSQDDISRESSDLIIISMSALKSAGKLLSQILFYTPVVEDQHVNRVFAHVLHDITLQIFDFTTLHVFYWLLWPLLHLFT